VLFTKQLTRFFVSLHNTEFIKVNVNIIVYLSETKQNNCSINFKIYFITVDQNGIDCG